MSGSQQELQQHHQEPQDQQQPNDRGDVRLNYDATFAAILERENLNEHQFKQLIGEELLQFMAKLNRKEEMVASSKLLVHQCRFYSDTLDENESRSRAADREKEDENAALHQQVAALKQQLARQQNEEEREEKQNQMNEMMVDTLKSVQESLAAQNQKLYAHRDTVETAVMSNAKGDAQRKIARKKAKAARYGVLDFISNDSPNNTLLFDYCATQLDVINIDKDKEQKEIVNYENVGAHILTPIMIQNKRIKEKIKSLQEEIEITTNTYFPDESAMTEKERALQSLFASCYELFCEQQSTIETLRWYGENVIIGEENIVSSLEICANLALNKNKKIWDMVKEEKLNHLSAKTVIEGKKALELQKQQKEEKKKMAKKTGGSGNGNNPRKPWMNAKQCPHQFKRDGCFSWNAGKGCNMRHIMKPKGMGWRGGKRSQYAANLNPMQQPYRPPPFQQYTQQIQPQQYFHGNMPTAPPPANHNTNNRGNR